MILHMVRRENALRMFSALQDIFHKFCFIICLRTPQLPSSDLSPIFNVFFFSPAVYTFYHWNTCFWIEPTDFYPALLSHKPTLACSGSLHALLQEFVFKKKKPTNNNKKTNKQKQQKPAIFTERPGSRPLHSLPTLD